jgi:hypothetical protein
MMSKTRVSIFGEEEPEALDVGSFAPKAIIDAKAPAQEKVRAVSEAANFQSREPTAAKATAKAKRVIRRYRTGRNVQFNIKAMQETVDAFYAMTEAQGWVLGFTLQKAVEALQRELKRSS